LESFLRYGVAKVLIANVILTPGSRNCKLIFPIHLFLKRQFIAISSTTNLTLLGGDGGVSADKLCEDSTKSFNAEREGSDVEKENVSDVAGENTALNGGTHGHGLIRVY